MPSESTPFRYHPEENKPISLAIIRALSKVEDHDIADDGYVLYRSIDPDALDSLLKHEGGKGLIAIEFTVRDVVVTVWDDGQTVIEIRDADSSSH